MLRPVTGTRSKGSSLMILSWSSESVIRIHAAIAVQLAAVTGADRSLERAGYTEALKCMKDRAECARATARTEEDQPDDTDAMTGDATLVGSTSGDISLDEPTPASGSHAGKSPVKPLSTLAETAEESPMNADSHPHSNPTPKSISLSPKKALSPIKKDSTSTTASPEKQTSESDPANGESISIEADGGKVDGMDEDSIFGDLAESEEKVEEVEEVEKPEEGKIEEGKKDGNELRAETSSEAEEVDLGYLYTVSRVFGVVKCDCR